MKNKFVITPNTSVIFPKHDGNGCLHSGVIDGDLVNEVPMRPTALIDYSLRHFGSNLKGASSGAKSILGNINMNPVVICSELDLFWFPCKSPESEECIWIAHRHVVDSEQIGNKKTKVYLSFGHTITIDMSKKSFVKKFNQTTNLKHNITESIKYPNKVNSEPIKGYLICKDPEKNSYQIKNEEE